MSLRPDAFAAESAKRAIKHEQLKKSADAVKKRISQETFDAAVAENMEEFDMEREEAIEDAIEQFKASGVDLSNIITSGGTGGADDDSPPHPVLVHLAAIKAAVAAAEAGAEDEAGSGGSGEGGGAAATPAAGGEAKEGEAGAEAKAPTAEAAAAAATATDAGEGEGAAEKGAGARTSDLDKAGLITALAGIADMCVGGASGAGSGADPKSDTGEATPMPAAVAKGEDDVRAIVGSQGGVEATFGAALAFVDDADVLAAALRTFRLLLVGNDENRRMIPPGAIQVPVVAAKRHAGHAACLAASLACIGTLCVKSEVTKRAVERNKLPETVLAVITGDQAADATLVRAALPILRTLSMNDDASASLDSKAFDFARRIASEGALEALLSAGRLHTGHAGVTADVLFTLATLTVNNDICLRIRDLGGLEYVATAVNAMVEDRMVARRGVEWLKKLAGNDELKVAMCAEEGPAMRLIMRCMAKHRAEARVAAEGAGALGALCLRNPDNARIMVAAGAHRMVFEAMRGHPGSAPVQRAGCMAVRNLVSRSHDLRKALLEEGAEALLNAARAAHPVLGDHAYAALRDLDLEVRGLAKPIKPPREGLDRGLDEDEEEDSDAEEKA